MIMSRFLLPPFNEFLFFIPWGKKNLGFSLVLYEKIKKRLTAKRFHHFLENFPLSYVTECFREKPLKLKI